MHSPIVCLLSDFGLSDHYVGAMKGEILKICPAARLVDISHQISPQSVTQGGFVLAQSVGSFPPGTVFLAVVDPGVGSTRRALACEIGDYKFVLPDNGLTSQVARKLGGEIKAVSVETPSGASFTFHGRDVFAPAAGRLASGLDVQDLGTRVDDVLIEPRKPPRRIDDRFSVASLYTDVFGNVCFDCARDEVPGFFEPGRSYGFQGRTVPFVHTFAEVAVGQPLLLWNSSGYLELAVRNGRADAWWEPEEWAVVQSASS